MMNFVLKMITFSPGDILFGDEDGIVRVRFLLKNEDFRGFSSEKR